MVVYLAGGSVRLSIVGNRRTFRLLSDWDSFFGLRIRPPAGGGPISSSRLMAGEVAFSLWVLLQVSGGKICVFLPLVQFSGMPLPEVDLMGLALDAVILGFIGSQSSYLMLAEGGLTVAAGQLVSIAVVFWPRITVYIYGDSSQLMNFGFSYLRLVFLAGYGGDRMDFGSVGGGGFLDVNISVVISGWTRDASATLVTTGVWCLALFRIMENRIEADDLLLAFLAILPNQVLYETEFGVWRFPPHFVAFRFSGCNRSSCMLVVFRSCSGVVPACVRM